MTRAPTVCRERTRCKGHPHPVLGKLSPGKGGRAVSKPPRAGREATEQQGPGAQESGAGGKGAVGWGVGVLPKELMSERNPATRPVSWTDTGEPKPLDPPLPPPARPGAGQQAAVRQALDRPLLPGVNACTDSFAYVFTKSLSKASLSTCCRLGATVLRS